MEVFKTEYLQDFLLHSCHVSDCDSFCTTLLTTSSNEISPTNRDSSKLLLASWDVASLLDFLCNLHFLHNEIDRLLGLHSDWELLLCLPQDLLLTAFWWLLWNFLLVLVSIHMTRCRQRQNLVVVLSLTHLFGSHLIFKYAFESSLYINIVYVALYELCHPLDPRTTSHTLSESFYDAVWFIQLGDWRCVPGTYPKDFPVQEKSALHRLEGEWEG